MSRILQVEDDTELASRIAGCLSRHGFAVLHEGRGDTGGLIRSVRGRGDMLAAP